MLFIFSGGVTRPVERVEEHFGCFLKSDAVFSNIQIGLGVIPFEFNTLQAEDDIHASIVHGLIE